jgi:serine/threonine-protein kinase HipA
MNGVHVGVWSCAAQDTLSYAKAWFDAPEGRPLSLSLPFQPGNLPHRGAPVRDYFSNLLPDSQPILARLAKTFKTTTDAFDLLAEIGRDCVGALQIVPEGQEPGNPFAIEGVPLDSGGVAKALASAVTPRNGFGAEEGDAFRISIAGAQEKTALLRVGSQWLRPTGATPTTHILKLPLGLVGNQKIDLRGSVENEWLCAQLLSAYGMPVAPCEIGNFNGTKALIVERFDRRWTPDQKALLRLPQEDMCQATGTSPLIKYESDGGPGMDRILELLNRSEQREIDRETFFQAQLLFWLLCAPDGHAKNFSIHLQARGAFSMTPLYDILSAYPLLGTSANQINPFKVKLAMAVRGKNPHWKMRDVLRRHWNELARRNGLGDFAEKCLAQIKAKTPTVIELVGRELPAQFPMDIAEAIFSGLQDAVQRLDRMSEN